jgi:hypothetical protein
MAKPKRSETTEQKARRSRKLLPTSIDRLERELVAGGGTYSGTAKIRGLSVTVRVIVRIRSKFPESWAMAILMPTRIDGIDWERRVEDHRGEKFNCSGWHRHVWKPQGKDRHKECLTGFNPTTPREFIRLGFKVLNVQLERGGDDARGKLFHD